MLKSIYDMKRHELVAEEKRLEDCILFYESAMEILEIQSNIYRSETCRTIIRRLQSELSIVQVVISCGPIV